MILRGQMNIFQSNKNCSQIERRLKDRVKRASEYSNINITRIH